MNNFKYENDRGLSSMLRLMSPEIEIFYLDSRYISDSNWKPKGGGKSRPELVEKTTSGEKAMQVSICHSKI